MQCPRRYQRHHSIRLLSKAKATSLFEADAINCREDGLRRHIWFASRATSGVRVRQSGRNRSRVDRDHSGMRMTSRYFDRCRTIWFKAALDSR